MLVTAFRFTRDNVASETTRFRKKRKRKTRDVRVGSLNDSP